MTEQIPSALDGLRASEERCAQLRRHQRAVSRLVLPLWPVFAPVDVVYPARLGPVMARTGPVESIAFTSGARYSNPVVSVVNRAVGAPISEADFSRRAWSATAPTVSASVEIDGRAHQGLLQHRGDSRLLRIELDGTDVLMELVGPRAPQAVRLERVTDLEPFRQRRFAIDVITYREMDTGGRSAEWRNPDAWWEGPPDSTVALWAHRGFLRCIATQLDELPVEVRPDFSALRALRVGRVSDWGFWFAAASHEQQQAAGGSHTDAERSVFASGQLVRFLSAHASWWARESLREPAFLDIAEHITGSTHLEGDGGREPAAADQGERDRRWIAWKAHTHTVSGRPLFRGSDADAAVLTDAWQTWADQQRPD